jgi:hypothetical protein
MFSNEPFYYQTIYKTIVAFGDMFNDIYISRKDANEAEVQRIKVPIRYGPKEKWLTRIRQDPDFDRQKAIVLPRMGFDITGIGPDPQRQFNKIFRQSVVSTTNTKSYQRNPVPYNLNLGLYLISRNMEDGLQVLEQATYFFKPLRVVAINTVDDMEIRNDVPFILDSVEQEDTYEGSFEENRLITWTLNFTAKINFYGPITSQSIIRDVTVDFHMPPGSDYVDDEDVATSPRIARYNVVPDPVDANPSGTYDYTETYSEYDDGKKYDPHLRQDVPVSGNAVILGTSELTVVREGIGSTTTS